jgi:hypothetical protein
MNNEPNRLEARTARSSPKMFAKARTKEKVAERHTEKTEKRNVKMKIRHPRAVKTSWWKNWITIRRKRKNQQLLLIRQWCCPVSWKKNH